MAKKKKTPIVWDVNELGRFKELVEDIKKRSEKLAQRIKDKVKDNLNHVELNPYLFEADLLNVDKDKTF